MIADPNNLVGRVLSFLVARQYESGERVPSERELATRFDVGRGQMREALSYLEALRIVERRAKSGLFMSETAPSFEALPLFAQVGVPLTAEDVHQWVEMRRIHEVEAVRLASHRGTSQDLIRMEKLLAAGDKALMSGGMVGENAGESDRLFHTEVVRSTQNDVFFRIVDIFYLISVQRRAVYFADEERFRQSHLEHRRIFEAIKNGDAEQGVDLMKAHLRGVDSYWGKLIDDGTLSPSSGDLTTAGDVVGPSQEASI